MKAWRVHENGEPREVMRLDEVPTPEPGPGQVLLKVLAANVNFPDAMLCRGEYQVRPPLPFTPGVEMCGEVVALGPGVTEPAVGTRVISPAALPAGAFAEYAVASARDVVPVPDGISSVDAAPLTCAGLTTYKALKSAQIVPTENVGIFGIGGLGHLAVQYARIMGGTVIAIDIEPAKLDVILDD